MAVLCIALYGCAVARSQDANAQEPKILNLPAPAYSPAVRNAGYGGEVTIIVLIDKKGKTKVVDSFGPPAPCANLDDPLAAEMRAAAEAAAVKATFQPATYKGKPVEKGITLRFYLAPERTSVRFEYTEADLLREGMINARATALIEPKYPGKAQGVMSGRVDVHVVVFEDGIVHYAGAVSGHKTFRRATVEAACKSTFQPALVAGKPVKFSGIITWDFFNTYKW